MDERDRIERDEMDDEVDRALGAVRPDGPLFDALLASLERAPLAVDPRVADAAGARLSRRLEPRRLDPRRLPLALAGLGLIAAAALAAALTLGVGSGEPAPTGPPVAVDVATPGAPHAAEAVLPPAPPEVVQLVRDRMAVGDWLGAWHLAAGVALSEADLRALAGGLHRAGHTSKDPETLEAASAAYESYFAAFPAGPADDEMRWAYAELLFGQERFPEAYEQYVTVVDRHPESRHAKFCAESAMFAAERLGDGEDPALDVWEERVVDAIDLYVGLWPDDPKAVAMNYRAGWQLLNASRPDDGLPYLLAVLSAAPETREAELAADLLVDAWGADAVARAASAAGGDGALLDAFADALDEAGRGEEAAALRE